ncbi:hypothetical protein C8J57DRAFT_1226388 [Mycena rebaudengoi]|nr:hypothetical protein C8J57DRAFT_1226388 [Mycena rebaudengoi]
MIFCMSTLIFLTLSATSAPTSSAPIALDNRGLASTGSGVSAREPGLISDLGELGGTIIDDVGVVGGEVVEEVFRRSFNSGLTDELKARSIPTHLLKKQGVEVKVPYIPSAEPLSEKECEGPTCAGLNSLTLESLGVAGEYRERKGEGILGKYTIPDLPEETLLPGWFEPVPKIEPRSIRSLSAYLLTCIALRPLAPQYFISSILCDG